MAYQASYGMYQEPRKKRGLKRIIFGILGMIANGIGLLVMPLVAGAIVAAFAVMSSTPVSTGGSPATLDASVTSLYYVSVSDLRGCLGVMLGRTAARTSNGSLTSPP